MPLYYDDSDLPVDWPMILVGWRGFAGKKLSAEQVTAHALEQIGRGTSEQDEVAALLANIDPLDWQTTDRYLEQLAGEMDGELALRKWRLAGLKCLLQSLPRFDRVYQCPEDEWLSVLEDLADFWNEYDELPSSLLMRQNMSAGTVEEMLNEQQAWLEREELALRGETGATK